MPLSVQQQIVTVRSANGSILMAATLLADYLERLPPARIITMDTNPNPISMPLEVRAVEVTYLVEFEVPIDPARRFPAVANVAA